MNASEKYNEQYAEIENQLSVLKAKLEKHKACFENKSLDWSFAADLGYVLSQLKEINSFLK